jgi:hypothetical protein
MSSTTGGRAAAHFDNDQIFDILRGVAFLTGSAVVGDLARTIAEAPRADLSIAFNHKQLASKLWLRAGLADCGAAPLGRILVCGGWHGVLSALLLDDVDLGVMHATSLDLDPGCAPVAETLNRRHAKAGRFTATTADMMAFDYAGAPRFDCIVNTSCEHIPDLKAWLRLLPAGVRVVLQSNDYRREPDHVSCVDSVEELAALAALAAVDFKGSMPTKNYTRFMLIGRL